MLQVQFSGSHVYYEQGVYTVTSIVSDDEEDMGANILEAAIEPIPAIVHFNPNILNLKSNDQWITCYLELPEGYGIGGF